MDKPDFTNPCYKTKDDKRHNTIWGTHSIDKESVKDREERIKNLHESRGTWVWDETKKEVVRKEDYHPARSDIDAPKPSMWNPEWTVIATGRRMSKGELKAYCKANGKEMI